MQLKISDWERFRDTVRKWSSFHRSDDETGAGIVYNFFVPHWSTGFFVRMWLIALLSFLVFAFVLLPCVIDGESMMPTYPRRGFNFCWCWRYFFRDVQRGDVVVVKYSGKVYFLKRVVALPGETVEFRSGELFVNGIRQMEPYVRYFSDWNLPPRKVRPGHYYVVGDNRSQDIRVHRFGQIKQSKIIGSPVW